jgi:hypothetical protein
MSTTRVKCEYCGEFFDKENKEINRCKKKGMKNFCSNSCTAKHRNESMPPEYWKNQYEKHPTLRGHENNRMDELSPFKYFLNKGRASIVKHKNDIDITAKDLKELWEKQNGICPYTRIKMILPKSSSKYHKIKSLKKASLDRIDSSLGYTKSNTEFVCLAINLAKNNRSKKEMTDFVNDVISAQNTLSINQSQPT